MENSLGSDLYRASVSWVPGGSGCPVFDGEGAEASKFDAVPLPQCFGDFVQHGINEPLGIPMSKMRIGRGKA